MPEEELPPDFENLVREFTEKILSVERLERDVGRLGKVLSATVFFVVILGMKAFGLFS